MIGNLFGMKPKTIGKSAQTLINQGSDTFKYTAGIIVAATTQWVEIGASFPAARLYEPLDSFEIINNSAVNITFKLSPTESYTIPAYMIKPIARRPVRTFGIENLGLVNTVAGDIVIHMRRLPPDIQPTVAVG